MRHNIDCCGSTKSESTRCRCWSGWAILTLSARQDVQRGITRGTIYLVHDKRDDICCNEFTNYGFTRYVHVLGARLLATNRI